MNSGKSADSSIATAWIRTVLFGLVVGCLTAALAGPASAVNPNAPLSLKTVAVPEPPDLNEFVSDRNAATKLGKALFWDMQVGSDGIQACASCHFHAGADGRLKNQVSPGLLHTASGSPHVTSTVFKPRGPNALLSPAMFPFHRRGEPVDQQESPRIFDTNDVASSMGVFNASFVGVLPGIAEDHCISVPDPIFHVGGINTRRVEPRNTPTVINAVFNFANFWDGRANNVFNGVNPFGPSDVSARILVNDPLLGLQQQKMTLINSSLASQAVGPPLSDIEMSCAGRTFPLLGRKMLSLEPLGRQLVHPQDSLLGPLSKAQLDGQGRVVGDPGLAATYETMIKDAFLPQYWNSGELFNGFTQMEQNFSFFFGLAVQMYEATLVSDDTPFDRFQEGDAAALTQRQQNGLDIFLGAGKCINCHGGPEFTNASVRNANNPDPEPGDLAGVIERMNMSVGEAFYDDGFYNIGVTLNASIPLPNGDTTTTETYDIGRGGTDAFGRPLSFSRLAFLKGQGLLDPEYSPFVQDLPCQVPCDLNRVSVDGSFKTPGLRNVELTGPFFHNGSAPALIDVVNFYVRGGNFPDENILNRDPNYDEIGSLQSNEDAKADLVEFLKALTDPRVREERSPFDHPQLFIPNGHPGGTKLLTCADPEKACDDFIELPAVGAGGRIPAGLPLVQPFIPRTFEDVAPGDFAFGMIEAIVKAKFTAGCSTNPSLFCPAHEVTRGQTAVFIERALGVASPPPCTGTRFHDVNEATVGAAFCGYIEDFAARGITSGCGGGNYCPNDPITRGQMAVFIERALGVASPPPCTGTVFGDINAAAVGSAFCGYIEDFAARGITSGCGGGNYCPDDSTARNQMAVFLAKAFLVVP